MSIEKEKKDLSFLDEVREQPDVLRLFAEKAFEETEQVRALEKIVKEKENPYFVFTGMGSSLYAGFMTVKYLQQKGFKATAIESLELQRMPEAFFTDDVIVIAVSQSGESLEVIDLLKMLPDRIPVIGVTNYPKSRLYAMSDVPFLIYAGTEYFTSTKSYTNTIAGMLLLVYRLAGCCGKKIAELRDLMMEAAAEMERMVKDETLGRDIAAFISDIEYLISVGSGYSYTTACHSELITGEATKKYSSSYSPAQFIHGPIELIKPGFGTLIYDFDPQYSAKCDEVRENVLRYGGKVLLVTNRTNVEKRDNQMICRIALEDPIASVLAEILPIELGTDWLCKERGEATGDIKRVIKRMAL